MRSFWTLTGLLLKSPRQWKHGVALALVVACALALLGVLGSLRLSPEQEAEMYLGAHEHRVQDVAPFGSELTTNIVEGVRSAVAATGATDIALRIDSLSVRPDDLEQTFSGGPVKVVSYAEDLLSTGAQADVGVYTLIDGVMPSSAGEIALSRALAHELDYPRSISVFGRAVTLRVTGVVVPRYGEESWRIIAGKGTWASFPSEQIALGYPQAEGGLMVLWDGTASGTDAVLQAVSQANPATAGPEALRTSHLSREALLLSDQPRLTADEQTYLPPSLVLIAITSLILVNLARPRALNLRQCLEGVGMSRASVVPPLLFSLAIMLLAGALCGCATGWAMTWLARASVLPALTTQPLSPFPAMVVSAAALVGVAVGAGLISALVRFRRPGVRRSPRKERVSHALRKVPVAFLRRAAAVLVVGWTLPGLTGAGSLDEAGSSALRFAAGLLLLLPDAVRIVVKTLSVRRVETLSARRMFEADPARYTLTATALAAAIALPTVFGTLYATSFRAEEQQNLSSVPAGQVWVSGSELGSRELVQRTVDELSEVEGFGEPIRIDYVEASLTQDDAHFVNGVWGIRKAADLFSLLGIEPDEQVASMLDAGGIIVWDKAGGELVTPTGEFTEAPTAIAGVVSLDDLDVEVDPVIASTLAGVILTSTAETLGVPVEPDMAAIYTDISASSQQEASALILSQGITPKAIVYNTPPQPLEFPATWIVILVGVAASLFVMVWIVFSSQARHLRSYAARMLAVGLGQEWAIRVLGVQSIVVIVTGLLGGSIVGTAAIALFTQFATKGSLPVEIPWQYLAGMGAGIAALAAAASLLSLSGLRPRSIERSTSS